MRGTELGNDESQLADSGLCDAYEARRTQYDAQSSSFQVLRATGIVMTDDARLP
jgi:hypothetical protein